MFRRIPARRRVALPIAAALICLAGAANGARADDHPVYLEWFETDWQTMEYRVPDFFMAGYSSVWIPPSTIAGDPTSPGYDAFDRFNFGVPGATTVYGTKSGLQAVISEFHYSSTLVYADWVMNHDSGRNGSDDFYNAGGYPGFVMRWNGDLWGDFHDGTTQSENPTPGPTDLPYNLWEGDLLGLIDIAQEKDYQFIRHPTTVGNAQNIPAGTIYNKPAASNAQFYPDPTLTPSTFVNPQGPPGATTFTIYPFNTTNPMNGVPYLENATGLLCRATQYMLDVMHVDGFRLDAEKHIPQWFWSQYWDSYVFNRRTTFAGNKATPFSFGEIVDSNSFAYTYCRKDGFGNRDALDINGAGALRDLLSAQGYGSWQNVLNAHLDLTDDGLQNGSLGVNHVYSQDNGSAGDGSSPPPLPSPSQYALVEFCYLLFRPGPAIVYHNSREFIAQYQYRGFWPREGDPTALGAEGTGTNTDLTHLVQLSNGYARGNFYILNGSDPVNQSIDDAMVFERRRDNSDGSHIANFICGVNDSYTSGVTFRNIQTDYAPGTRLHELTGNHGDPLVDPQNQISELLVVDSNQRILMPVPYNVNANGVAHYKGYVVYGEAAPSGTLAILDGSGNPITNVLAPDASTVPNYQRRLATIPIVTGSNFQIALTTSKTDPSDPAWDDNAFFKIDAGFPSSGSYASFNGDAGPDFPETDPYLPLYANFNTVKQPLYSTPGATNGIYTQTVPTDALSEGYHYIKIICFRHRPSNTDPIYTEFRQVIYVDRHPPAVTLMNATTAINTPINTFSVLASDRTTNNVYLLLDPPNGSNPLSLINLSNQATRYDRFQWNRTISGLSFGNHTISIVAFEIDGNSSVTNYTVNVTVGSGDINHDGVVDINDLYAGYTNLVNNAAFDPNEDVNGDGVFNLNDLRTLESLLRPTELQNMSKWQR